ncbi:GNAT family N-acetyltransferase [Pseudobutyrivibrio xylanivorans]|uniref:Acetyltransferase (GNAT) domain-containing protein n=1 Tax=Pseudobutyrivibrio xylanivorans TaxID=185007 RepID=A0A1G5S447_PSEXY|nr:GNAT family N-acetyltransferase [Pseudobutyrivibrio xylanivorans]SCZ81192.1 Acetyltransferase (GNAT) domain-containing protein [Pseudobutyrivibrio xylanivorans]
MDSLKIDYFTTNELTMETVDSINNLKNQHWKHTKEEHMQWFIDNIKTDDKHVLIWKENELLAYLNLVHVDAEIDNQTFRMYGIGNVCVSKEQEHTGIGSILMSSANAFIKRSGLCGLLLCHENTLKFYECCGWSKIDVEQSFIKSNVYEHFIMFYDPEHRLPNKAKVLMTNRNF